MNSIKYILAFAAGGCVGYISAVKLLEKKLDKKYDEIVQKEIQDLKAYYAEKPPTQIAEEVVLHEEVISAEEANRLAEEHKSKPDIIEFAAEIAKREGYTAYDEISRKPTTKEEPKTVVESVSKNVKGPKVISPQEFSLNENEYDVLTLTFYEHDGVLCDDEDNPIMEVEELIGFESLARFGEYEPDCVYVKNDEREVLYEVLREEEPFVSPHNRSYE